MELDKNQYPKFYKWEVYDKYHYPYPSNLEIELETEYKDYFYEAKTLNTSSKYHFTILSFRVVGYIDEKIDLSRNPFGYETRPEIEHDYVVESAETITLEVKDNFPIISLDYLGCETLMEKDSGFLQVDSENYKCTYGEFNIDEEYVFIKEQNVFVSMDLYDSFIKIVLEAYSLSEAPQTSYVDVDELDGDYSNPVSYSRAFDYELPFNKEESLLRIISGIRTDFIRGISLDFLFEKYGFRTTVFFRKVRSDLSFLTVHHFLCSVLEVFENGQKEIWKGNSNRFLTSKHEIDLEKKFNYFTKYFNSVIARILEIWKNNVTNQVKIIDQFGGQEYYVQYVVVDMVQDNPKPLDKILEQFLIVDAIFSASCVNIVFPHSSVQIIFKNLEEGSLVFTLDEIEKIKGSEDELFLVGVFENLKQESNFLVGPEIWFSLKEFSKKTLQTINESFDDWKYHFEEKNLKFNTSDFIQYDPSEYLTDFLTDSLLENARGYYDVVNFSNTLDSKYLRDWKSFLAKDLRLFLNDSLQRINQELEGMNSNFLRPFPNEEVQPKIKALESSFEYY